MHDHGEPVKPARASKKAAKATKKAAKATKEPSGG